VSLELEGGRFALLIVPAPFLCAVPGRCSRRSSHAAPSLSWDRNPFPCSPLSVSTRLMRHNASKWVSHDPDTWSPVLRTIEGAKILGVGVVPSWVNVLVIC
jgi:hypothetical protein